MIINNIKKIILICSLIFLYTNCLLAITPTITIGGEKYKINLDGKLDYYSDNVSTASYSDTSSTATYALDSDKLDGYHYNHFISTTGNIRALDDQFWIGETDPFGRPQLRFSTTDCILLLGEATANGDARDIISEGAAFWGKNAFQDALGANYGYIRLLPNRLGLYHRKVDGYAGYIFKVDTQTNEFYYKTSSGTTLLNINQSGTTPIFTFNGEGKFSNYVDTAAYSLSSSSSNFAINCSSSNYSMVSTSCTYALYTASAGYVSISTIAFADTSGNSYQFGGLDLTSFVLTTGSVMTGNLEVRDTLYISTDDVSYKGSLTKEANNLSLNSYEYVTTYSSNVYFNAAGANVLIQSETLLDFPTSFAINIWVDPDLADPAADGVFLGNYNLSGNDGIIMVHSASGSGKWQSILYNSGAAKTLDSDSSPTGNAQMLTFIRDSSNNLYFYVDGVKQVDTDSLSADINCQINTYLGVNWNGSANPYKGYIDELQVRKGNYWSDSEILAMYNSGSGLYGTVTDDTQILLHLDGDCYDGSLNNNNGTKSSLATYGTSSVCLGIGYHDITGLEIVSTNNPDIICKTTLTSKFDGNYGDVIIDGHCIKFYINGNEKLRLARSGNLGFGIINPDYVLDINGQMQAYNIITDSITIKTSANGLNFYKADKTKIAYLNSNGFFGINTEEPMLAMFEITQNAAATYGIRLRNSAYSDRFFTNDIYTPDGNLNFSYQSTALSGNFGMNFLTQKNSGNVDPYLNFQSASSTTFKTNGDNQRMKINQTGDVQFGISGAANRLIMYDVDYSTQSYYVEIKSGALTIVPIP